MNPNGIIERRLYQEALSGGGNRYTEYNTPDITVIRTRALNTADMTTIAKVIFLDFTYPGLFFV
jgi:hypothetical protein